ncbi:hypothetical protein SISSUDRAFT_1059263 [Sistotremastrum suecicum HHB10207 ss-3]|uniref:Uncharacterized protein n=1 Tax=Sistotremastrum suecicum HHB10207 ss-3 TaxID=1314776 RepID=A0A166GK04_9AGAM|nr:hypothetical protein SISSUDRAFT_1059263 [Sistotremastrum suecicum HHB10207 ss-3]
MAQAIIEDHPLREYLRDEAGESIDNSLMLPGIHISFFEPPTPTPSIMPVHIPVNLTFLAPILSILSPQFREHQRERHAAEKFAELFKYKLVSSSLLATNPAAVTPRHPDTSFSAHQLQFLRQSQQRRHRSSPDYAPSSSSVDSLTTSDEVPGHFGHNVSPVTPVVESEDLQQEPSKSPSSFSWEHHKTWIDALPPFPVLCLSILIILIFPWLLYTLCVLFAPIALSMILEDTSEPPLPAHYSRTLDCLDSLIEACQSWDITTSQALSYISPQSSTIHPPLSHSLLMTLTHTSTHASTIRGLLSALARSPEELEMLSRMYGPPSPPMLRSFPEPEQRRDKRNSWAPGYDRRPLSLSFDHEPHLGESTSTSTPHPRPLSLLHRNGLLSPPSMTSLLEDVPETSSLPYTPPSSASDLPSLNNDRSRPRTTPSSPLTRYTSRSRPRSLSKPPSLKRLRANTVNVGKTRDRDPLSLASLTSLRDQARANVRHTAACLLGLRFTPPSRPGSSHHTSIPLTSQQLERQMSIDSMSSVYYSAIDIDESTGFGISVTEVDSEGEEETEEEDALYWDDVQSVLSLLRSALEDGSDRLADSIADHERGAQSLPSPPLISPPPPPVPSSERQSVSLNLTLNRNENGRVQILDFLRGSASQRSPENGFAPLPSHLARFVNHVEQLQTAIDDAWDSLRECVDHLAESSSTLTPSTSASSYGNRGNVEEDRRDQDHGEEESPALQAYDRLRRNLGVAFREGERGRASLAHFLHPPMEQGQDREEEEDRSCVPDLVHDDEGSSTGFGSPMTHQSTGSTDAAIVLASPPDSTLSSLSENPLSNIHGSSFVPVPLGIEQVFEADSLTNMWTRERSKLSREERIKFAQARREEARAAKLKSGISDQAGLGLGFRPDGRSDSRIASGLGPGGEVVQELKDVIWQVGERRRKSGVRLDADEKKE